MELIAFDHVNVRTAKLDEMIDWYGDVLGLAPGKRPDFPFPGAWLYLGNQPYIHLVDAPSARAGGGDITLEHFAFRATGLPEFRKKLQARGIEHSVDPVPGFPIVQVNLHDPEGNHIHIDFDASEHSEDT
ncbi:VOC family protein [Sulfitobacter sp. D35]|uniref:VOC family protein n=1 Tax=Sulfitobacter sp. D35 TaxID=3083252 RepID=UPI00296F4152|nr:VOC family protein [Sulfitobacter sp. D35]MDW4498435.1 VOC family protein [Sulfitobacter sp. D35]